MSLDRDHTNGRHHPGGVGEIDPSKFGPCMLALSEKRQLFVQNLFMFESAAAAYRAAGFGEPQSSGKTIKNGASRLQCDPAVHAAILELGKLHFGGLMPLAISQTRAILANPENPEHGKTLRTVLSVLVPQEHKQTISVHHHDGDLAEREELARRLAEELGIDPVKFLGCNRTPQRPMKQIEHAPAVDETTPDSRPSCKENDDG